MVLTDLKLGDSVAVNGVCLTVASFRQNSFTAHVMGETLSRTCLGSLIPGNRVNMERAILVGGRFGGHMVSGHIDGMGKITKIQRDDHALWYTIQASSHIMRYVIEKGSIAIDGISLTVASIWAQGFSVSLIPHTAKTTIMGEKTVGAYVNLECDMIGKYVEKLIHTPARQKEESHINKEFLSRFGY